MDETKLYRELGELTKDRARWKENIPYVGSLLSCDSVKIQAKALWMLGEMGLAYSQAVKGLIPDIAFFLGSPIPLLRQRAMNALGRIGRGDWSLIEFCWNDLFRFASDTDEGVRLSFIWASENIATNCPDLYADHLPVFASLLSDEDEKVRMEAPEIFRVLGKRRPEMVRPYLGRLRQISEIDPNRVVRLHCLGAIRAMESESFRQG